RSRIDPDRPLAVVDVERGARVPHAFSPPEPGRNRPQARTLSVGAGRGPALGYRCFELVEGAPEPPATELAALENEHYRLELDVEGGRVVRLRDREIVLDLLDVRRSS